VSSLWVMARLHPAIVTTQFAASSARHPDSETNARDVCLPH
jgi:hypothetical protein